MISFQVRKCVFSRIYQLDVKKCKVSKTLGTAVTSLLGNMLCFLLKQCFSICYCSDQVVKSSRVRTVCVYISFYCDITQW